MNNIEVWTHNVKNVEKFFPLAKLTIIAKLWHQFMSVQLLPNNNMSEVIRDKAILNYYIQMEYTINFGCIIE